MIAIDTNIIVRLIVGDDEQQVHCALDLAANDILYVSFTVLVETEWVLRARYGYDRATIVNALANLPDLVLLHFENEADARWALDRYAEGGELADFLHIAAAHPIGRFATFERKLARRAGADSPAIIETLA